MTHHHCTPPPHLKTKVLESSCLTPYPSSPSPVSRLPSPVSHHLPSPVTAHLPSPVTAHLQTSDSTNLHDTWTTHSQACWVSMAGTSCLKPMTCPHDMSVSPPPQGHPSPTKSPVSRLPPSPVSHHLPSPVTAHLQSSTPPTFMTLGPHMVKHDG